MTRIRRILFATDFSKASGKAFDTAVSMAKLHRAALTILNVIVPFTPMAPDQFVSEATWEEVEREAKRAAQAHLARLTVKAKAAGVRASASLLEGDPAQQIARAAQASRADLLVVGTHGRTGLVRFFVGSVASRLVATATCPVMTVKAR
jgi:nucleotide-binding universal stress UspA family protein